MLGSLAAAAARPSALCTPALRLGAVAGAQQRRGYRKFYKVRRVDYPWKDEILKESWGFLHQEMIDHFQTQPQHDSTVHIRAEQWPRFTMTQQILEANRVPAQITRYGPERRVVFDREELKRIAFDEPQGHLSHLFKGRLFRVHVDDWIEECVVADCSVHPVEQEIYFVKFERHVPGKMTKLPIPVTLSGVWGCPGYQKGGFVDISMPTVMCEVVGDHIPPPFLVDVGDLHLDDPYGKITLGDLQSLLPKDGTVRFAREYSLDEDVVMCYDPKKFPEVPLPADYEDPNFVHRGGRYHLTYTGFWPKQTTRS